eukprot:scaffold24524_cov29-Phaeocystis_antarctica.AAC.1
MCIRDRPQPLPPTLTRWSYARCFPRRFERSGRASAREPPNYLPEAGTARLRRVRVLGLEHFLVTQALRLVPRSCGGLGALRLVPRGCGGLGLGLGFGLAALSHD